MSDSWFTVVVFIFLALISFWSASQHTSRNVNGSSITWASVHNR
jgi:hypothetical protein